MQEEQLSPSKAKVNFCFLRVLLSIFQFRFVFFPKYFRVLMIYGLMCNELMMMMMMMMMRDAHVAWERAS